MHVQDEFTRQRELDAYRIVDTLPQAAYDDIVRLAAHLCGAPVALVSLLDRERQWFKARAGFERTETERRIAFCEHAIRAPGRLLEVADAANDPRFRDNPLVAGPHGVRFYAGMPLVTPEGAALGTLCVLDRTPRRLEAAQQEALGALARLTVELLEARRRLLDAQRAAILERDARAAVAAANDAGAAAFSVVIVQVQRYADLVERRGGETVELHLDRALRGLEMLLHAGERIERVPDTAEFVLTLAGVVEAHRLNTLRGVAERLLAPLGEDIVCAAASSGARGDSPRTVFERADEALTRAKNRRISLADARLE